MKIYVPRKGKKGRALAKGRLEREINSMIDSGS